MTAYYASLPVLIHPLFNLAPSFTTDEIIIVIAAAIAVLWNVAADRDARPHHRSGR